MRYPMLLERHCLMRFRSRTGRAFPRTREGRLLAEFTLTHVHDVGVTLFKNDPSVVNMNVTLHLVNQSDCPSDLFDGLHLFKVNLVRATGAQVLVGEFRVCTEPKSSVTYNYIYYIQDGEKSVGGWFWRHLNRRSG